MSLLACLLLLWVAAALKPQEEEEVMRALHSNGSWMSSAARIFATLVLASCTSVGLAWADDDDDDDGYEIPFTEAQVLLQLNDTDGDLGFHARIDGEPWTRLYIEDPREKTLLKLHLKGRLKRQGLTEFAFESAEPTFDELDPKVFFKRFPEGEYEIEGRALEGGEMESTSVLSHVIPAAPANLMVSGEPAPEDCDGDIPVASDPIVISWDPVESSHADLGKPGDIEVDSYEVAIEGETIDITLDVEGDVTEVELAPWTIPAGEEVKYQVLVREGRGNESSSESCFIAP